MLTFSGESSGRRTAAASDSESRKTEAEQCERAGLGHCVSAKREGREIDLSPESRIPSHRVVLAIAEVNRIKERDARASRSKA